MSPETEEQLAKLLDMGMKPKTQQRFFFSKEINLGHLVVALTFLLGAFATYLSFHDSNVDHQNRVKLLEQQQDRTDKTISQLTNNQTSTEKAVTQLTWIVEQIQKDKK